MGPMPQSIPFEQFFSQHHTVMMRIKHNSPLKEELKMQFFFYSTSEGCSSWRKVCK